MALNPTINPYPLGKIAPTSGNPISLGSNTAETSIACNSIFLQGLKANAGDVYIGASDLNRTTLAGVVCVIAAGQALSIGGGDGLNPLDVAGLYADVDTTGDAILVSIVIR